MRKWLRLIEMTLMLLIASFLATVLTAWSHSSIEKYLPKSLVEEEWSTGEWKVTSIQTLGRKRASGIHYSQNSVDDSAMIARVKDIEDGVESSFLFPEISDWLQEETRSWVHESTGFPIPAFSYDAIFDTEYQSLHSGRWRFGFAPDYAQTNSGKSWWGTRAIPLRPDMRALFSDIAFWSAFLLLLAQFIGPTSLIRTIWRMRRSHCPRCNYLIEFNPSKLCSECGFSHVAWKSTFLGPATTASYTSFLRFTSLLLVVGVCGLGGWLWSNQPLKGIHRAARGGDYEALARLLSNGVDPDLWLPAEARFDSVMTPLHFAVARSDVVATQLLLEHGANPDALGGGRWTPLQMACRTGDLASVRTLIEFGASLDPGTGLGPLGEAIRSGHIEIAEVLLTHEAGVPPGYHPLEFAIACKKVEMVDFLVKYGFDISSYPGGAYELLVLAVGGGDVGMVKAIVRHGAQVRAIVPGQCAILFQAPLPRNAPELWKYLISEGAILDSICQTSWGETLLHRCARNDDVFGVDLLLRAGADPLIRDNEGQLPNDIAKPNALDVLMKWKDDQ